MTTQVGTSDFPVSVALGGGRRQEVRIGRHTTWTQFRQRVYAARLERERGRGTREREGDGGGQERERGECVTINTIL